jgi:hypothetical protein
LPLYDDIAQVNQVRSRDPFHHRRDGWVGMLLDVPFGQQEKGTFAAVEQIWRWPLCPKRKQLPLRKLKYPRRGGTV